MTGINFKSVALVLAGISIALAGVMVLLFWPRRVLCIDAAQASDDDGDSEFDESEDCEDDWDDAADIAADSWL